jgi:hypothetical protein
MDLLARSKHIRLGRPPGTIDSMLTDPLGVVKRQVRVLV